MAFVSFSPYGPDEAPHPAAVDESVNLSAVCPRELPRPENLLLPLDSLSTLQRETVALVLAAFARQKGFLLGDSTGLGKGRVCAATLVEGALSAPGSRGLWVSTSMPLYRDAQRDMDAVDCDGTLKWGTSVCFTTYKLLQRNLPEFVKFLRKGPTPTIILDEVHAANNPTSLVARGVYDLHQALPCARVLYSTATSASRVDHLSFLQRLHLWGPGAGFESFEAFCTHLKRFGCTAGELLAAHLKREGLFVSRQLSMQGIGVNLQQCRLTHEQRNLYDECVRCWSRPSAVTQGSLRHRFFQGLLTAFKMPSAIALGRAGLQRGCAVIFAIQGTGEAQTKRAKTSSAGRTGDALPEGPPSALRALMIKGEVPHATLRLPLDPLDAIMQAFGIDQVSELTGRTTRAVPGAVWRWAGKPSLNDERQAFQEGTRSVAVISRAGSTGISLHAEHESSRPRMHVTIELPWSSEAMVQQCGRSHRAGQTSLPEYYVLVSDVPAELRFVSTVAARLHQLGALKHGDRNAASSQGSQELLRLHATSGVTIACLRRASVAVGLIEATRAFPGVTIKHGTIDHSLLRQNANRAGSHRQTYTDQAALSLTNQLVCDLRRLPSSMRSARRGTFERIASTIVSTVPAARFAALKAGVLIINDCRVPVYWTPATHWLFPKPFRMCVRTLLLACQCPEGLGTFGTLTHDLVQHLVERMANDWTFPGEQTLDLVGRVASHWGRQSVEEFLNEALSTDLSTQQHMIDAVSSCVASEDKENKNEVMSLEKWVLPANACRGVEFVVTIESTQEVNTSDELHVQVLVKATPSLAGQLQQWRSEGRLTGVWFQLNGQLVAGVRSTDNAAAIDTWQPGRSRRTKRLTMEQYDYEREEHSQRARVAKVRVRSYESNDTTIDVMWETQAEVCGTRLEDEARRRSRICVFVYRNPLASLEGLQAAQILRVESLGFTGLLLRELPYNDFIADTGSWSAKPVELVKQAKRQKTG
jgi:hypothetical protein